MMFIARVLFYMYVCNVCTQLTFDEFLESMAFSDNIYLSVFYDTLRNTLGVDAKMYLKMPTDFLTLQIVSYIEYESHHEKTCANNKDTDQLVGLHNLISACVDHCQNTIIDSV